MAHPVVIRYLRPVKIIQCSAQDDTEIRITDPASVCRHDIVESASLVKSQRQRTILVRITEREFHLVAVTGLHGRRKDSFPSVIMTVYRLIQKTLYLSLFEL